MIAVSVSTFEGTNVRTCDTLQGDSLPLVDALTDRKDANDKEDQLQPAVVELSQSDSKEESGVIIPAEGSSPRLNTYQPVGKLHLLSEAENSTPVLTGHGSCESIDQSIPKNFNSSDCNRESQSKPEADIPNNVIQDCGQEMDIDPAISKSTAIACDSGGKQSGVPALIYNLVLTFKCLCEIKFF